MGAPESFRERMERAGLEPTRAIVTGSGILDRLGIRQARDLDVVVAPDEFDRIVSDFQCDFETFERGRLLMRPHDVEVWDRWTDRTASEVRYYEELLPDTVVSDDGVRYISLGFIRDWKLAKARDKDLHDVALINKYLEEHDG